MPNIRLTIWIWRSTEHSSSNLASSGHSKASPDVARPGIPSCCFWPWCRQPWEWIYDDQHASLTGKSSFKFSRFSYFGHWCNIIVLKYVLKICKMLIGEKWTSAFCEEMNRTLFGTIICSYLCLFYSCWIINVGIFRSREVLKKE